MESIDQLAAEVAAAAGPHADRHDLEGSFATEGIECARDNGYLAAAVPPELGGSGGRTVDLASGQRIIARACGSTALAISMHTHVVLGAAWRWRHNDTVVEPLLRRVAGERIIVVSTGGNDWTKPSTVATPVDGGWRINGRKTFASISPAADMAATFAVVGEPAPGAPVIVFGLPFDAPGVRIDETWNAAGMRATGSHDVVLEDVFVGEGQLLARREWGALDRALLVAGIHAMPVIYATYLGVAEALLDTIRRSGRVDEPHVRLFGRASALLQSARWALAGVLADITDDPDVSVDTFMLIEQMRYLVSDACQHIGVAATELAGGGAYARRGAVDRMIRDLRAALFHPYPPETALVLTGQHQLGLPLGPV